MTNVSVVRAQSPDSFVALTLSEKHTALRIYRRFWPLAALLVAALAVALNPSWAGAARRAFSAESIGEVAAYLRSFGIWTPLLSLVLMVAQAVIAPLPGSLIAAANGVVFGLWWGTLLSWTGGLLGGTASFWLARLLGRDAVNRLAGARLERANQLSEQDGFWIVLIARLVPLISFDFVSYLAGLSRLTYRRFLLATAIGMLPGTFAWTALGHDLTLARASTWRLSLIGLFFVVASLMGRWWLRRNRGRIDLET
jgi:uncharacterized membrane protein YdjX (TVP38/TMEM64 family)